MALLGREQSDRERQPPRPTVDQLRSAIDHGAAGDKVRVSDPAAAPLGTDDEAAGAPPTADRITTAYQNEIGRLAPAGRRRDGNAVLIFVAILIIVVLAIVLWATL